MFENIGVVNFSAYLLGAFIIIVLPGPNSLYVLATGAGRGVKAGYQAAMGILVGDTILLVLTAAGAASVLHSLPALFYSVRIIGALYLGYLGVRMLWSLYGMRRGAQLTVIRTPDAKNENRFVKALMLSLLNPKAILFLMSFFIQFVDPSKGHPWLAFLVLGLCLQLFSVVYLSVLIFGGTRLANSFRRHQYVSGLATALVAVLFIVFAFSMVLDA